MKKFKDIRIKVNPAPKATFGTNPKDPWSAKYNIAEGLLDQYLASKGFDPRVITPNQKVSYAKSSAFIKWKQDRMAHHVQGESYNGPRGDKLIARSHAAYRAGDKETSSRAHKLAMKAGEKYRSDPVNREKAIAHIMSGAKADYNKPGRNWTGDSVEYPEDTNVISEISDATLNSYKEKAKKSADDLSSKGQHKKSTDRWMGVMKATGKQIEKTTASIKKHLNKEDTWQDSYAATQTVGQEIKSDDPPTFSKNKKLKVTKEDVMKSARIIKSIYKNKKVAEETYDWEKDDKSVKTYGKKPTMSVQAKEKSFGENKPDAAAIMSGGKTLTGDKRDTIEIDPMMKVRPGSVVFTPASKKSPQ
jgi:hypothetical protein